MVIIGEKEVSEGNISVRDRATDQTNVYGIEEFAEKLKQDIRSRALS